MPTELPTTPRDPIPDGPVAIEETDRLIASNKVEGTAVYNLTGEHLGSIYNFMVDKFTGHATYAVVSFGGFLGLGERYFPIPWEQLSYDERLGGYVVDVDKDALDRAPSYAADDAPWNDPAYGRAVHDHYKGPGRR